MLVKDFKPKYQKIELIIATENVMIIGLPKLLNFADVKREYSFRQVLSVKDYDKTKSTSLIIGKEDVKA